MTSTTNSKSVGHTFEDDVVAAVRASLREALAAKLSGYSSPLDPIVKRAVDANAPMIEGVLNEALSDLMRGSDFRQQLKDAAKAKIAKVLIDKFGGEIEKRVNDLKSDPTTRAKITLAIEAVVSQSGGAS